MEKQWWKYGINLKHKKINNMNKKTKVTDKPDVNSSLPSKVDIYFIAEKYYSDMYFKGVKPLNNGHLEFLSDKCHSFMGGAEHMRELIKKML